MTSNEEMAEKLAEKFYGLIEGDVSVSGGELDELEHMRDVADMAYMALSDLALHCHNRREDVAWGIASSAAKDAHVLATFVGDWIEDMEDED